MTGPIIVLSVHEKGFPVADYHVEPPEDAADEWFPPDGFKTGRIGEPMADFRERCAQTWPGVEMVMAVEEGEED